MDWVAAVAMILARTGTTAWLPENAKAPTSTVRFPRATRQSPDGLVWFDRPVRSLTPGQREREARLSRDLSVREMEAAAGLEPANNGFAIRRLSHLAMPPTGEEG